MEVFKVNPYLKYFGRCLLHSLYKCHKCLHIHKHKVKSATLQKFPMRNIHDKLNIFNFLFKDLFFLTAAKWNFGIITIIVTILGKIRSRRHLAHLSQLTSLFWKIWVNLEQVIIFYLRSYFTLRFKKMISDTFAMKSIDFLNWKMPKE